MMTGFGDPKTKTNEESINPEIEMASRHALVRGNHQNNVGISRKRLQWNASLSENANTESRFWSKRMRFSILFR